MQRAIESGARVIASTALREVEPVRRLMILPLVLALVAAPGLATASVELVSLSEFGVPRVLDMQSAPDGPIEDTDGIFTAFGLTSITGTSDLPGPDGYNGGDPFFRSLFYSETEGLLLVSLGVAPFFDRKPSFTIQLDEPHRIFGVAPVDTLGDVRIRFKHNGAQVGEMTFFSDRESTYYFRSTSKFDEIVLDQPGLADGWGIDNLTLDNQNLSAPTSVPIAALTSALAGGFLGSAGLFSLRKNRVRSRSPRRSRARSHPG